MANTLIPVYEALARDIRDMGVECVFGLMSDDTAQLISMIDAAGVRFYGARHENNAAAMAEGYAAATGKLGIVILGRGPATANGIHGLTYAQRTRSPVLMILGEAPNTRAATNGVGPDRKGFNSVPVLNAAGIRTFVANSADSARDTLRIAANQALRGACALLLPSNVQQAITAYDAPAAPLDTARPTPKLARDAVLFAAKSILEASKKPVIIAGWGAHVAGAKEAIVTLADQIGAALVTTMKAKDMFAGHPFDCGVLGSFSNAGGRRLIEQADCVLVIGAGMNQQTTSFATALPDGLPVIHVDANRTAIGQFYHADVSIVGDAKIVSEQLAAMLPTREIQPMRDLENTRWLSDFNLDQDFDAMNTPRTMDARSLGLALDAVLPKDRNLVYDSGNFLVMAPYITVPGPAHFKQAADFASIGMGFGTAMGFAVGRAEETTCLLMGDGSFLMTMSELETVAREGIPLVIFVVNDCAYGAELHFLQERNMAAGLSVFPDIDYAPVAEAFGFETATVRTLEEVAALAPILAAPDGPILVDCKVNASVIAPFLLESHAKAKG